MEPIGDSDVPIPGPAPAIIEIKDSEFPWWLVIIVGIIAVMSTAIVVNDEYREAFEFILPGIRLTLFITVVSFVFATVLGLFLGLMRISKNGFLRNFASTYIEMVRGIPVIVWLFIIAFVLAPDAAGLVGVESRSISFVWRGIVALSLFYASFIAEVFRAGIQSVPYGQIEAGRAMGLKGRQNLRLIVLPQAIRNMLPALGNDLISLFKDTSLLSVLAVREITQLSRLYTGSTFRFREAFFILAVFYISMTLVLSLVLRWYEKRIEIPGTITRT
jgi:polar amino acid transport system permease protein